MKKLKTFDLNVLSEPIEAALNSFDFETAHGCMVRLNHTWAIAGEKHFRVPAVIEVENAVRKRLTNNFKQMIESNQESFYSSCGGYVIECFFNENNGYWARILYAPVETLD